MNSCKKLMIDNIEDLKCEITESGLIRYDKHNIYLNLELLDELQNNIMSSGHKFIYPLVYVNFAKRHKYMNKKINISPEQLMKLRLWSNQIRSIDKNLEQNIQYGIYLLALKILKYVYP